MSQVTLTDIGSENVALTDDQKQDVEQFKAQLLEIEADSPVRDVSVFIERLQTRLAILLPCEDLKCCPPNFQVAFGNAVGVVLLMKTERKFKKISTVYAASGGLTFRWYCSNNGAPTIKDDRAHPIGHEPPTQSTRCGCKASFKIKDGQFIFNLQHNDECKAMAKDDIRGKARPFEQLVEFAFPTIVEDLTGKAVELLQRDRRLDPKHVKAQIIGAYRTRLTDSSHRKEIADLRLPEVPPDSWVQRIFKEARFTASGEVSKGQSIERLLHLLQNNPEKYAHRELIVEREVADVRTLKGLHMWMKEIAPDNLSSVSVFTADVTHGICDSRAGPHRISFISAIDEAHNVDPVVFSMIESEDKDTFVNELLFLLELDPTLPNRDVVFIVDGDRGRIAALKLVLPRAHIFLCMWHKHQNVKKRLVPLLQAEKRKEQSAGLSTAQIKGILKSAGIKLKGASRKDELMELLRSGIENRQIPKESLPNLEIVSTTPPSVDQEEEDVDSSVPFKLIPSNGSLSTTSLSDLPTTFSIDSSKQVFEFVASGHNRDECLRRLDLVVGRFPDLKEYVDVHLRPNVDLWGKYNRVWVLTFGLVATTMQENFHWSAKSHLDGKSVLPHELLDFMRSVVETRRRWTARKGKMSTKDKEKLTHMRSVAPEVVKAAENHLTHFATMEMIGMLNVGLTYNATRMETIQSIRMHLRPNEQGPSALRFSLLLALQPSQAHGMVSGGTDTMAVEPTLLGRFFLVSRNATDRSAIVHVLENGALACSCGEYASWGMICIHICSVYYAGWITLNPYAHLHPHYLKRKDGVPEDSYTNASFCRKVGEDRIEIASTATWNTAVKLTEEAWNLERQGKSAEAAHAAAEKWQHERVIKRESEKERFHKIMRDMTKKADEDPAFRKQIIDLYARYEAMEDLAAVKKARLEGRNTAMKTMKTKQTPHRAKMAEDKTARRPKAKKPHAEDKTVGRPKAKKPRGSTQDS